MTSDPAQVERFDELVEAGHGTRFDANKGTPMREWFTVGPGCPVTWSALATEALQFALTSGRRTSGQR